MDWDRIIQKGIEGGYEKLFVGKKYDEDKLWAVRQEWLVAIQSPRFWQALGKACGWKSTGLHKACLCDNSKDHEVMEWEMYALTFHEINLTEGYKQAMDYLKDLIK